MYAFHHVCHFWVFLFTNSFPHYDHIFMSRNFYCLPDIVNFTLFSAGFLLYSFKDSSLPFLYLCLKQLQRPLKSSKKKDTDLMIDIVSNPSLSTTFGKSPHPRKLLGGKRNLYSPFQIYFQLWYPNLTKRSLFTVAKR